jgi:hypothetical protein
MVCNLVTPNGGRENGGLTDVLEGIDAAAAERATGYEKKGHGRRE